MEKTKSGGRIIGKVLTAVMILILAAVIALTSYIGGQDKAVQKYCAALSMGSLSDYTEVTGRVSDLSKEDFRQSCRSRFSQTTEFADLSDTDSIGSKVKVTEHRRISASDWSVTADADFFSSGRSVSFKNAVFTLRRTGGRWYVSSVTVPDESSLLTAFL